MTLAQVAERAGTSTQQINRLEKGQRELTLNWVVRLADAMDCYPIEILPEGIGPSKQAQIIAAKFDQLSADEQDKLMSICDVFLGARTWVKTAQAKKKRSKPKRSKAAKTKRSPNNPGSHKGARAKMLH